MEPSKVREAAEALRQAQLSHSPSAPLVGDLAPRTLVEAYDIQDALFESWSEPLGVLKGALTTPAGQEMFALAEQTAGRVPASGVHGDGDELPAELFCQAPFLECELALRVGPDGHADAVAIAIEVAAMRLEAGSNITGLDMISDNMAAAGLVIGEPHSLTELGDLTTYDVRLSVNGEHRAAGSGSAVDGGPLASYAWVVAHERSRGREPTAGTWVITGSMTGVTPIVCGDSFAADFGPLGSLGAKVALELA